MASQGQLAASPRMAEGQTKYLVKLLLRLKMFKFLWLIVVIASAVSNHIVFPIVDTYMGNFGRTLTKIDASEFLWNSAVMLQVNRYQLQFTLLMGIIKATVGDYSVAKNFFQVCNGQEDCSSKMFKSLYGNYNSSKYTAYVDYGAGGQVPEIICQVAYGADLHCPFFGHLVASTANQQLFTERHIFEQAHFFSLTARAEKRTVTTASHKSSCAMHDGFDVVISRTLMIQTILVIGASFFYFLASTISCIVDLKKNGFLKIMFQKGLSVRSYWIAVWSVTSLEILLIAVILALSHVIQCPGFYKITSVLAVLAVAILQLFAIAAMGIFLTVVLRNFFHIGLTMVLIALCACVFVLLMEALFDKFDLIKIILLFVLPIGHLGEFSKAHLLSVTLQESVTAYHHLILVVTLLFLICCVAVTLYVDYVLKTGNGYCMQMNYVTDKRFWNWQPGKDAPPTEDPLALVFLPETANIEPNTEDLRPIVRVSEVTKHYFKRSCVPNTKPDTVALNNISAHIYESHITAIIGHNGSGKTTLLNILNGTDLPTHGQVSVDGLLVNDPINRMRLRRIIGICPQENSLSSALTVQQTLEMAQMSCNRSGEDTSMEIEMLLEALHMTNKTDVVTSKLSGGSKRKLCTAVALIGDSKLLFLDEPTSGVDPVSRRQMWKLLQTYKLKCSIILSTQSMDEADTLADRKIFLSGGSLICAGSSLFLKSAFDCGFDFNVTLKSATHAPLIIRQVQQEFKSVRVKNQFQKNVDFHLPAADLSVLPALAQALERRKEWILAFGLLQASLYDIFMRLRDLQPAEVEDLFREGRIRLVPVEEEEFSDVLRESKLSGIFDAPEKISPSACMRFRAMASINGIRVWRSRVKLCSRIITPIILLMILFVMAFIEKGINNSQLQLYSDLTNYGDGFKKGVCVFRQKETSTQLSSATCGSVLSNSSTAASNFLALPLSDGKDLLEFLQEPEQLNQIKGLCSDTKSSVECPIVYSNGWREALISADRTVYIGSFSTYEQFNSSTSASVTMGAYYRLARYFLGKHISKEKMPPNAYAFTAKSVYKYQTVIISLLGTFVQLFILSFLPATFLDDLIEDKETKVRNQLSSAGLGITNYWVTMYFVHWLQYAVIYLISVIFVVAINSNGYASGFYLAGIVLPTLIFGLSNNQLTVYILSSLLNKSNPIVTVAYFFFSILLVIIVLAVQLDNVAGVVLIALVPPFASIALTFHGTKAIFYTISYFKAKKTAEVANSLSTVYASQPHILGSLVCMIIHFVVLTLLLSVAERRLTLMEMVQVLRRKLESKYEEQCADPGVMEEIQSLDKTPRNEEHLLEMRHLRMAYPNGAKVIRDVSFAASPGEIFGLLGPNGAGKSTTMAVMVGELRATGGRCELLCGERWLSSRLAARRGYIGYCPQYNPQYDDLTAREHLEFYACILGVQQANAKQEIDLLLQSLSLDQHEDKLASQLSFGCKRRLSLAASLLGDPCLLVIDEASTGVDPEGKRVLWRAVRALASHHHSIVISTHSMEEAEALCSRVSVMNLGLMVGLGSVQQLKSRYGQSYTLEVLIDRAPSEELDSVDQKRDAVVDSVTKKFSDSSVVEEFTNRVTFSIPMTSIGRLSQVLSWLAEIKQASHILYFSFYQMSLDQVFSRMIVMHNGRMIRERRNSSYSIESVSATSADI